MAEPFDIVGEHYVSAILDSFGGLRPMAKQIGLGVSTVQGWKQRGKIPANRLEMIAESANKNGIILPTTFYQTLEGDPAMDPNNLETDDISVATEYADGGPADIAPIDVDANSEPTIAEPTMNEPTIAEPTIAEEPIVDDGDGAFRDRSKAKQTPPSGDSGDGHDGHGAKAEDLPKSTAAHWALLLSFIAIIGVVTRPLWSDGIDKKLQSKIGGHGDEHGEEGYDDHGEGDSANIETGAVLDRLAELEERLSTVEQASSSLALLSFNLQQKEGSGVFGEAQGVSAEELQKLEDARMGVELLKKESVSNQVQFDSLQSLLNQLEENTRLLSRRLESVELESGQLFERNFSRSIGLFYALEVLDARIRDGLAFGEQLENFDDLTKNTPYRDDVSTHINLLRLYEEQPILALPILAQQYSDFLYPVLVKKTDSEAEDWQEQVVVRVRSLVHFKKQEDDTDINDLLRAEYFLGQGNLSDGIRYASPDIIRYGQGTQLEEWLDKARARQNVLNAIDEIRRRIGNDIIDSIQDLRELPQSDAVNDDAANQ